MIVAKVSTSPPSSFEFLQTVRLQFFTVTPGDMIHLPIHGGEADLGSPASSSGASPPATEPSWSPTKIRRIANAGLPRLPLPRRVKDLPPLDTLQICHIVHGMPTRACCRASTVTRCHTESGVAPNGR